MQRGYVFVSTHYANLYVHHYSKITDIFVRIIICCLLFQLRLIGKYVFVDLPRTNERDLNSKATV